MTVNIIYLKTAVGANAPAAVFFENLIKYLKKIAPKYIQIGKSVIQYICLIL